MSTRTLLLALAVGIVVALAVALVAKLFALAFGGLALAALVGLIAGACTVLAVRNKSTGSGKQDR